MQKDNILSQVCHHCNKWKSTCIHDHKNNQLRNHHLNLWTKSKAYPCVYPETQWFDHWYSNTMLDPNTTQSFSEYAAISYTPWKYNVLQNNIWGLCVDHRYRRNVWTHPIWASVPERTYWGCTYHEWCCNDFEGTRSLFVALCWCH